MANEALTKEEFHQGLGEFTEQVLLPAVERIVEAKIDERVPLIVGQIVTQRIGEHRDQMIDYIDRRLASTSVDIVAALKGDRERDQAFKTKVLDVFRRHKLVPEDDLHAMEALVR